MALQEVFPGLFGITCANDASVAALVELSGGVTQWNAIFAKVAHDWEVEAFVLFFRVLHLARIRREGEDKLWWVPSEDCLVLNPSTMSWVVMMVSVSLEKVFGGLRFH